ncbi:BlaI/MecI/CopY family transcriptional regulator [Flexithrix dorotheae]|uniref:BlaI/MecI/CopY family transcriptional regulator n=1 Tax=Flexithrix dorotheae TaxID=70993 RepID=UPI00035FED58|nr:BlaI/MecI/CopY family transcriptional regulator [Flexithrix dorotheae]
MKKLTTAEEQIMQVLWKKEKAFVKDILPELPADPKTGKKPAYNTVSTIVRILESKGFVAHNAYGKTHEYYPLVDKDKYSNMFLKSFISSYFSGSFEKMVSFFVKQNDMDVQEMEELMKLLEEENQKEK